MTREADVAAREARVRLFQRRAAAGRDLFTGEVARPPAPLSSLFSPEERAALDALAREQQRVDTWARRPRRRAAS